jgi:uncharacterized protein YdaT
MIWNEMNTPFEINELEPHVREKAIEIANQLKKDRTVSELSIVPEAIKRARQWFLDMEG